MNFTIKKKNREKNHGLSNTRLYHIWGGIVARCYIESATSYPRYGKIGIGMSEEWRKSFLTFYDDMKDSYFDGATIDRIDNKKGYSKENCRWATYKEQGRNYEANHWFNLDGKEVLIEDLVKVTGIKYGTLYRRLILSGWSLQDAITRPVRPKPTLKGINK
jgi:hypothetical protein